MSLREGGGLRGYAGLLIALVLIACGGQATLTESPRPTVGPTSAPTQTPVTCCTPSAGPTATVAASATVVPTPTIAPTPPPSAPPTATPAPTAQPIAPWDQFGAMLQDLGITAEPIPIAPDPKHDSVNRSGEAQAIAGDLDLLNAYVGWVKVNAEAFGTGGPFECDTGEVFCWGTPSTDQSLLMVAMQTNGHISFGGHRDASLAVAFDRPANDNALSNYGPTGFAGFDKVVAVVLDDEYVVGYEYSPSLGWVRAQMTAAVKITSDTAVFLIEYPQDWGGSATAVALEHAFGCHTKGDTEQCDLPGAGNDPLLDMGDTTFDFDSTLLP